MDTKTSSENSDGLPTISLFKQDYFKYIKFTILVLIFVIITIDKVYSIICSNNKSNSDLVSEINDLVSIAKGLTN
jgi:hypothetical protein